MPRVYHYATTKCPCGYHNARVRFLAPSIALGAVGKCFRCKKSYKVVAMQERTVTVPKLAEQHVLNFLDVPKYNAWTKEEEQQSRSLRKFGQEMFGDKTRKKK